MDAVKMSTPLSIAWRSGYRPWDGCSDAVRAAARNEHPDIDHKLYWWRVHWWRVHDGKSEYINPGYSTEF